MFKYSFFLLCFTLLLVSGNLVFAQELDTETQTHTFTEIQPPPPTRAELERVSFLSEKYIAGTLTGEELAELSSFKSDFSDLEAFRQQYQTGQTLTPTSPEQPMTQAKSPYSLVAGAPLWLVIISVSNTILLIFLVFSALARRRINIIG